MEENKANMETNKGLCGAGKALRRSLGEKARGGTWKFATEEELARAEKGWEKAGRFDLIAKAAELRQKSGWKPLD